MRIFNCGTFVRFEFDNPHAFGYFDVRLPRWIMKLRWLIQRMEPNVHGFGD